MQKEKTDPAGHPVGGGVTDSTPLGQAAHTLQALLSDGKSRVTDL